MLTERRSLTVGRTLLSRSALSLSPPPGRFRSVSGRRRALLTLALLTLVTVWSFADSRPAQAQITEIVVPKDWALIPSGMGPGDSFRLMGVTVGGYEATSRAIQPYNKFVRDQVRANGHVALTNFRDDNDSNTPFDGYNIGGAFNVVGCGGTRSARANTGTQGDGGVPIYWVNGDKIADNYGDFYDGEWDSTNARKVGGAVHNLSVIFTGCNNNGFASANPLGGTAVPDLSGRTGTITHNHLVQTTLTNVGRLNNSTLHVKTTTVTITEHRLNMWVRQPDGTYRQESRVKSQTVSHSTVRNVSRFQFYAMSPIFTVEGGSNSNSGDRDSLQFSDRQSEHIPPDTSALQAAIQERIDRTARNGDSHSNRIWQRALAAVRGEDPPNNWPELTAKFAQRLADNHLSGDRTELADLWQDIADTLNGVTPPPPPPPPPTPDLTITGGPGVTEGAGAVFTITASPAPTSQLTVQVNVTQTGDYTSTGSQTLIIPANHSTATVWVSTTDDTVDEPDGSVTATLQAGSGYTLGSSNTATIAVTDNDDPPPDDPELTITGGPGVTEGSDAIFTISASPTATSPLQVNLSVSQSGDFASSLPSTVTLTGGSATLRVGTTDDSTDEADGSITVALSSGSGYTVSGSQNSASVAVSDNDDPPPPPPPPPPETAGSLDCDNSDVIVDEVTIAEDRYGMAWLEFNLTLCEINYGQVLIDYHMEHITTDDSDVYLWSGTLIIEPFAQKARAIRTMVHSDGKTEGDETVALVFTGVDTPGNPINLGHGRVKATITDPK